MYLTELLEKAELRDEVDSSAYITLIKAGTFSWSDISMVVTRADWEDIFVRHRAKEPDIEPVFNAILDGSDKDFMRHFGSMEPVQSRYVELRSAGLEVDTCQPEAADGGVETPTEDISGPVVPAEEACELGAGGVLDEPQGTGDTGLSELGDKQETGMSQSVGAEPGDINGDGDCDPPEDIDPFFDGVSVEAPDFDRPPFVPGTVQMSAEDAVQRLFVPPTPVATGQSDAQEFEFTAPQSEQEEGPSAFEEQFGAPIGQPQQAIAGGSLADFLGFTATESDGGHSVAGQFEERDADGPSVVIAPAVFTAPEVEEQGREQGGGQEADCTVTAVQAQGMQLEISQPVVTEPVVTEEVSEIDNMGEGDFEPLAGGQALGCEGQDEEPVIPTIEETVQQSTEETDAPSETGAAETAAGTAGETVDEQLPPSAVAVIELASRIRSLPAEQLSAYHIEVSETSDSCTKVYARMMADYRELSRRITFSTFKAHNGITSTQLFDAVQAVVGPDVRYGALDTFEEFISSMVLGYAEAIEYMARGKESKALDVVNAYAKYIYEG